MKLKLKGLFTFCAVLLIVFGMVKPVVAQLGGDLVIHNVEAVVKEDGESYTVKVRLSVLGNDMQPVENLDKEDFTVSEDEEPVEIDDVEFFELNISAIVMIDISGSMYGNRFTEAQNAISSFIQSLYRGDKIAVYTFNTEVQKVIPLTDDKNQAQEAFDALSITPDGGNCLFDAVYAGVQDAKDLPEGRRAVIVLNDGEETTSSLCSDRTVDDIVALATEGDQSIPIYTIGVGTELDKQSLTALAEKTGGVFRESASDADLTGLFEQLANRLSSEYELTYTSKNTPASHTLKVNAEGMTDTVEFDLPGLPPVISIATPAEGQTLEPTKNDITLSLVERGISIDSLAFQINGVAIGVGGEVSTPPKYTIDFSQYAGQEVDLTVLALDKNGKQIAETSMTIPITEEVTIVEPTPTEKAKKPSTTGETSSGACPAGGLSLGNLCLRRNQLIIAGAILVSLIFIVVMLIVFLGKKKGKTEKHPKDKKKESLFEDATIDGFAIPGALFGRLTILSSDDPLLVGKEFQLMKSPTTVGRSVSNDIAMPKDSAVSRQHIEIVDDNGDVILREVMKTLSDGTKQPPTYGTYVNDRKVTGSTSLHNGDEISLGRRTKLRFEGTGKPKADGSSEDVTVDQISLPDLDALDDATRDG